MYEFIIELYYIAVSVLLYTCNIRDKPLENVVAFVFLASVRYFSALGAVIELLEAVLITVGIEQSIPTVAGNCTGMSKYVQAFAQNFVGLRHVPVA